MNNQLIVTRYCAHYARDVAAIDSVHRGVLHAGHVLLR
jgi:hypothetical protein